MGKKIDTFILSAAVAAGFYFFYQRAFSYRFLSLLLALISFIVLRKTLNLFCGMFARFGWLEKRRRRRCAGSAILTLAMLPEEETQKKLSALIKACFGEETVPVVIQNHPSIALTVQQVFEAWKRHQGRERLVLCATCPADAACMHMAASLKNPKIALIDGDLLSQMIAEHPNGFTFDKGNAAKVRFRISHIFGLLFNRRNAPRCMLAALSMLAIYLFSAKAAYLACGIALLFAAFASMKRRTRPVKLF